MRAVIAFVLNFNVALYYASGQAVHQGSLPASQRFMEPYKLGGSMVYRERRDSLQPDHHIVEDCMLVTSDEGQFFYKAPSDEATVCGVYMVTDPAKRIEMIFTYMFVPCESSGLLVWVDGWELNGQTFPAPRDHPKAEDQRFSEFCGERRLKQVFVSSQNAALLMYRIPAKNAGFTISVRHIKNPAPCNVLLYGVEDIYTLRNHGKRSNCSLTAVYPSSVRVVALNVGVVAGKNSRRLETGTIHKCQKRGLNDFVEIGGSAGLDNADMERVDSVCGLESAPARAAASIFCECTTVRLVSSGEFDNSVTIAMKKLGMDDILNATHVCGI